MIEEINLISQGYTDKEELVSVIVPVYKVEKYLSKCLESILKQTYYNLQIILVDDGSPDRCGAICDNYAKRDQRIEVIHKENGGLASVRNTGLKAARGEWIAWVDSDDWIERDMIEYLIKGALQNKADIAICGRYEVYENSRYIFGVNKIMLLTPEEALQMLLDVKNREIENFVCDKLWRKSLFDGIKFPEGKTFEDFAVTFRLLERANAIVCLPDAKYNYFQREGSIMRNISITNQINRYDAAKVRYDEMIENWPQFETMLIDRCIRLAVNLWTIYYNESKKTRFNVKEQLRDISCFLTPYIKAGFHPETLGRAGQLIVKLIPYPYGWSFAIARGIQMLYNVKRRFTYRNDIRNAEEI